MTGDVGDTWYNAYPELTKVPLYRRLDFLMDASSITEKDCIRLLSTELSAPPESIFLTDSGTTALWLVVESVLNSGKRGVVVPSFVCPSVVKAIISAGGFPQWCDLEDGRLVPSAESMRAAVTDETAALILAPLLGQHPQTEGLKQFCELEDIELISDYSQVPNVGTRPYCIGESDKVVLSFGRTKPLPIGGGGALIVYNLGQKARRIREQYSRLPAPDTHVGRTPWFADVRKACLFQLEKPITSSIMASEDMHRLSLALITDVVDHGSRQIVQETVQDWGRFALYLSDFYSPYATIKVNNKERHKVSSILAKHGVVTTWLYYPMHYICGQSVHLPVTDCTWKQVMSVPNSGALSRRESSILADAMEAAQ